MGNVIINKQSGTSGRQPVGFDFYSGLSFIGTAPSVSGKWATQVGTPSVKYQQMTSISDATAAGIVPFTDNTASTSTAVIVRGSTGDTINITCAIPVAVNATYPLGTKTVDLGTYTQLFGDSTLALLGASIAAMINAGTYLHGFSASFTTATLTITAPKSAGKSLNTGSPYTATVTGTITATITQNAVAGTASQWSIWYYHISRYFVQNPSGNLVVGIISSSSSFNELTTLQAAGKSKLRQIGVYDTDATRGAAANIAATLLSVHNAALVSDKTAPYSVLYSPNFAAVSDLLTYPDANLNTSNKVSLILSQDGDAAGALLYVQNGQTIGSVGECLGMLSKSRVSSSFAQPISDFNAAIDGAENNVPAFGNGLLLSSVASGTQTQLDNYRAIFFRSFGDAQVGTYLTSNKTCIASTSNYCFINDNRVADKVSRTLYSAMIPQLESELIYNSDGTLQDFTIENFKTLCDSSVTAAMITGKGLQPEISGIQTSIDPTQPVKQTNNLVINCNYIENGIARSITINLSPVNKF